MVVVGVHSGRNLTPAAAELDAALGGALSSHLEAIAFLGDLGEIALLPTFGRIPAAELLVAGLGPLPATSDALRRAAGAVARRTSRFATVAIALPEAALPEAALPEAALPEAALPEAATTVGPTTQSAITEAATTDGPTAKPATTDGPTAKPATTVGPTTQSAITEAATTDGPTAKPATTVGPTTQSAITEAATTDGTTIDGTTIGADDAGLDDSDQAQARDPGGQAVVEGYLLGSYRFDRYKSAAEARKDTRILIASPATDADLARGQAIAEAVIWARNIVNEPAGGRGPATFAELARQRAEAAGLAVEILDEVELRNRGMNGILGVGQGSRVPPRLLILRYEPEGATGFVGAIGKGITFDSGGLSLKPADSMETMKTDCSGAAAVVAAMCALPALGPKIRVVAAAPLAENMPGGGAIKPGDVIRHYGGRTSEVLNTDAEGRLVLADALAWMAEQRPDAMIDFATLTGAMTIALGKKVAGFFATSPTLAAEVNQAAEATGERVWQLPFIEDLRRQGDSDVADIKNIGTRWGGAIFAALFLREFTGGTPWVHVDIAGPARSEEAEQHISKGPTGMGTRLLIEWIEQRANAERGT